MEQGTIIKYAGTAHARQDFTKPWLWSLVLMSSTNWNYMEHTMMSTIFNQQSVFHQSLHYAPTRVQERQLPASISKLFSLMAADLGVL